jgi:hypothetical protein
VEGMEALRQDQERFEFRKRDVERKRRCAVRPAPASREGSDGRRRRL